MTTLDPREQMDDLLAEQANALAREEGSVPTDDNRRSGVWIGHGDFEFDCDIDGAVVSVIRDDPSTGKPEVEVEFKAGMQRLIDMRDGADRALRAIEKGAQNA